MRLKSLMKKLSTIFIVLLLLLGCQSSPPKTASLKVLSPSGAPALSVIPLFEQKHIDVEITSGADLVQAALVNPNSEYDAIIAPINLGVHLLSQNKTAYKLHSVITWGNLYLLGKRESLNQSEVKLAGFGQQAVVGTVLKAAIKQDPSLDKVTLEWFASVSDAQMALLTGMVDLAMVAMPLAQATLAKAKELNKDIELLYNVQELYQKATQLQNFPQAALFIHEDRYNEKFEAITEMLEDMTNFVKEPISLKEKIEKINAETLGVPSADLIIATYDKLALNVVKADSIYVELSDFLNRLNLNLSTEYLLK